jgi:ABC-type sugar transport system, permease component
MKKATLISIFTFAALVIILLFEMFPVYWVVVSSFRTRAEIVGMAPLYPTSFRIENFYDVFIKWKYYEYVINSLLVATGNTLLVILITLPAAYALARFRIRSRRHLSFWFLQIE